MAHSHDALLNLLDAGKVATGQALSDWIATDSDDIEDVNDYLGHHLNLLEDAADYDVALLRTDVANDRELLLAFADEATHVTRQDDPKLRALVEELAVIAADAKKEAIGAGDERDKRKVLVFSYFADTVAWIVEHLSDVVNRDRRLTAYRGRIAALSGSFGSKEEVLWGFAPVRRMYRGRR